MVDLTPAVHVRLQRIDAGRSEVRLWNRHFGGGRSYAAADADQFTERDLALPLAGESQQRVSRVPGRAVPESGATALPAVGRNSSVSRAASGRDLVRFAASQGNETTVPWAERR